MQNILKIVMRYSILIKIANIIKNIKNSTSADILHYWIYLSIFLTNVVQL